jgi:hypothetical protein
VERAAAVRAARRVAEQAPSRRQRPLDRLEHLEQRQLGGRPGQGVAALLPGPGVQQPGPVEPREHARGEGAGDAGRGRDLGGLAAGASRLRGEPDDRADRVVGLPRRAETHRLAPASPSTLTVPVNVAPR